MPISGGSVSTRTTLTAWVTYVDSDNVCHGEKRRQSSAQLCRKPRILDLIGLQWSVLRAMLEMQERLTCPDPSR